ncbi:hypothetical protein ABK040_010202 [Willaertia magna]
MQLPSITSLNLDFHSSRVEQQQKQGSTVNVSGNRSNNVVVESVKTTTTLPPSQPTMMLLTNVDGKGERKKNSLLMLQPKEVLPSNNNNNNYLIATSNGTGNKGFNVQVSGPNSNNNEGISKADRVATPGRPTIRGFVPYKGKDSTEQQQQSTLPQQKVGKSFKFHHQTSMFPIRKIEKESNSLGYSQTFRRSSFKEIPVDVIVKHLHLPQKEAAKVLKVSVSTLKRRFYAVRHKIGIDKWPNTTASTPGEMSEFTNNFVLVNTRKRIEKEIPLVQKTSNLLADSSEGSVSLMDYSSSDSSIKQKDDKEIPELITTSVSTAPFNITPSPIRVATSSNIFDSNKSLPSARHIEPNTEKPEDKMSLRFLLN